MRGGDRKRPAALLAVAVVLSAAACGGSGRADDAGGKDGAEATSTTATAEKGDGGDGEEGKSAAGDGEEKGKATTTTAPGAKGGGSKSASGGSSQGPGAKAAEEAAGGADEGRTIEVSAEVASECVRPGGTQTVTVRTKPYSIAGFDTYYSDGLAGMHPGFHGGNMVGSTDGEGVWSHTWVVGATAPPGQAVVVVTAINQEHGRGETGVVFVVADPTGLCDPPHYEYVYE